MEYEGKEQSPYKGVLGSSIFLIVIPTLLFLLVFGVINKFSNRPRVENINASLMFGVGCGFIFQLSCILMGLFKGTFKVVINRVKNFFSNLTINFKFAITYYWEDIKSEGIVFWIYFLIIGSTFGIACYGTIQSLLVYLNYK